MATNRSSEHLRYRYGICLNDNCQKCKNKEVQQIYARKEFVCAECGKPLRECPPPKSVPNKMVIVAIATVIIIAAGIGIFLGFSGGNAPEPIPIDSLNVQSDSLSQSVTSDTVTIANLDTVTITNTETRVDTVKIEKTIEKETTPTVQKVTTTTTKTSKSSGSTSGTLRLSYGNYTGSTKNGYPHGQGRLVYTTSRHINRYDTKERIANPGDYVIGEFYNGFVVYGKHYDSDGNLIGSLNFGVASEDIYESK